MVECFDILTNTWHTLNSLTRPRTGTTALSVGNRYIYLFPGLQKETWNTIEFLDLGLFGQHPDPRNFKQQKWNILSITNPDLSQCFSFASIQLTQNELLLFGGFKTKTYLFDFANTLTQVNTSKTNPNLTVSSIAKVTTNKDIELCAPASFSYESDYVARLFGNYLYAIDNNTLNLHVYSLKDRIWNFSPLKDLGVLF